jgi:hypothetical protein
MGLERGCGPHRRCCPRVKMGIWVSPKKGWARRKDVPLGKKLGQGEDGPWDMILPQGKSDHGRNIIIHQGSFHCVSQGRSRDVNVANNGLGVGEKDLEGWTCIKEIGFEGGVGVGVLVDESK